MEHFTPLASTLGGVLIGLSAALMLFGLGRIAGISGIFGGLVIPRAGDLGWRASFVIGLLVGGLGMLQVRPELFAVSFHPSMLTIGAAGLLVGFGTRMGNGCTSGHGVCGLARLSVRSLVATLTFMAMGAGTVFVAQHLLGAHS